MAAKRGDYQVNGTLSEWQTWLLQDVFGYTNLSIEEIGDATNSGQEINAQEWKLRQCGIEEFYRTNTSQFWDEVHFNLRPDYWDKHFAIKDELRGQKIIDFGCGIGSSAIYLAANNYVIGYEINEKCLDFCQYRKTKFHSDKLNFTNTMPDVSECTLLMAIDVLEHIENLHDLIMSWGKNMKPGCVLFHADVFENHPDHHPMHFDHSKNIDSWLREAGFNIILSSLAVKV
jgi:2-polyprenyl-3-methyl-5-hydroxy-6-metoxy-1,4-benzoquinol methylase